jgi:hypothetical protein
VPTGRLRGDADDGAPGGPVFEEEFEEEAPEEQAAVATTMIKTQTTSRTRVLHFT